VPGGMRIVAENGFVLGLIGFVFHIVAGEKISIKVCCNWFCGHFGLLEIGFVLHN
jgi:hypothetical protein